MRIGFVIMAAVLAACGSKSQPVQVTPTAAPAAVATAFLQAVADSNLAQMGELWGTSKGPAATTNEPSNWMQRLAVVHAYLRGTARVTGDLAGGTAERPQLMVELIRPDGCKRSVPFTMVRTRQGGWLVQVIDLNAAGVPGRPCNPSGT